jgi:DNA transposition AAA+ family ATPase
MTEMSHIGEGLTKLYKVAKATGKILSQKDKLQELYEKQNATIDVMDEIAKEVKIVAEESFTKDDVKNIVKYGPRICAETINMVQRSVRHKKRKK